MRAHFGQFPAESIVRKRQSIAGLARRGDAIEVVIDVSDVRVGPRQVLQRHPVEVVEGERDAVAVAQPAAGDVGVGVVSELLIIGRAARVGALGLGAGDKYLFSSLADV